MSKARLIAVVVVGVILLAMVMPLTVSAAAPGAPIGLSPANGTVNISLTHTFLATYTGTDPNTQFASWWQVTTVSGNYSDNVLVYNSGVDKTDLVQLAMHRGYLMPNTTYYWHVKQQDIYGNWSPWSAECGFTTVLSFPPRQPDNVSPANGQTEIGPAHTFISSAYYDPDGDAFYALQAQIRRPSGDGSSYDQPLWDSGVKVGSLTWTYPAGLLEYNHTYYWRIRYQDDTGLWSPWSDETSFTTIANSPPSQPQNYTPSNGATGVSLAPTLTGSAFVDPNASETVLGAMDTQAASWWQVRAASGSYASPAWDSDRVTAGLNSITIPAGVLSENTTYYWHVAYQDSYGNWSDNSAETSFTLTAGTGGEALQPPTAVFSSDKAEVTASADLVTFTDNSTPAGKITSWSWDFGDNTTENWTALNRPLDGQITHLYKEGGTHTVFLTVTSAAGQNTVEMQIVVHAQPQAGVLVMTPTVKAGSAASFKDTSSTTGEITSWLWQFDDGTQVEWSAENRPASGVVTHTFSHAGSHAVSLTVTGSLGTTTVDKTVSVTGRGGFHFGLWMVAVGVAVVVLVAGVIYLIQARKTAK